jgi:hypothetical protein
MQWRVPNLRFVVLLTPVVLTLACADGRPFAPAPPGLSTSDVVGEAAAALDASGHFVLPPPHTTSFAEIDARMATKLAVAYIADYGEFLLGRFEHQHGGPIDLATVSPCGTPLYASTPYETGLSEVSRATQRAIGPHWLVTLCSRDATPTLSVAVSALAKDLVVAPQAPRLARTGSAFFPAGIPLKTGFLTLTPERAAALAARASGRRVSAVPELIMRRPPFAPQLARWKVTLEAPVKLKGAESGNVAPTSTVFVGFARSTQSQLGMFSARAGSPTTRPIHDLMNGIRRTVTLQSRAGVPVATELATPEGR